MISLKAGRNYLGLILFMKTFFQRCEDKQFYHCFGCGRSEMFLSSRRVPRVYPLWSCSSLLRGASHSISHACLISSTKPAHQALYDMHEEAARFYHAILTDDQDGRRSKGLISTNDGLTDDVLKHFQIGLAPAENSISTNVYLTKFEEKFIGFEYLVRYPTSSL